MSRLRVLVLTKTTALGGAERLVMNSLPYLDRAAFDYRFAALDDDGPLARACDDAGHEFGALPHTRVWDPRTALALRRRLVRERIDVVHAHLPLPGALARLAARGTPVRVVYTEHTTQDVYRAPSRWLNAASYGWQDVVVAVSGRVRVSAEREIGDAARGRIAVVPNGVDFAQIEREAALPPSPEPPRRDGAIALLIPANLVPIKGHEVLFESLCLLRERGLTLDVWAAGGGPERAALERRARALDLGDVVHFLGPRRDIFALMAAADGVVLPSWREGHPLALLEALALGRPAIASAVGGIPEIVEHERTGLLVPAGDAESLAGALARIAGDPELRVRLGRAGRRAARARFDVRRNVAEVEAIYQRAARASVT